MKASHAMNIGNQKFPLLTHPHFYSDRLQQKTGASSRFKTLPLQRTNDARLTDANPNVLTCL